jgi:hypothetical protein
MTMTIHNLSSSRALRHVKSNPLLGCVLRKMTAHWLRLERVTWVTPVDLTPKYVRRNASESLYDLMDWET